MTRKTIVWILLGVVVLGGAWYVASNPRPESTGNTEWTLSASFSCADGTYFMAAFPSADYVSILVDGEVVRAAPRVEGVSQRFEDSQMTYVFAGEEVSVTTKATGAVTTCTQPFDPNNAPVNFGDAGEGGGQQGDIASLVSSSILGTWKSNEDPLFVREFTDDGKAADLYNGELTTLATWSVFTDTSAKDVAFPLEPGTAYVKIVDETAGTLTFKVQKLTPETLELVYMDRGNMLTFTRVP